MRVKVEGWTQVNIEGTVYGPGEELEVEDDQAQELIRLGWAGEVPRKRPKARPKKA